LRAIFGKPPPTVFHVTHYKAGSQWIYAILRNCLPPRRLVQPQFNRGQFLDQPVLPGKVYPTLYVTRDEFEAIELPPRWRRFVVIRDLRDTLVSGYFSIKLSHPAFESEPVQRLRETLRSTSLEEGLVHMTHTWLATSARIQESWLDEGQALLRYEDLLERDIGILEPLLIDECALPVARWRLRRAIKAARFERASGGRARGTEDVNAHQRKGVAGDWRTYFTPAVKEAFKDAYGEIVIAAGYETDTGW
jgi:lipopolysaccharide transport system ATP-binding protein